MIKLISVPCFYLMELDLGRDFGTDMDVDFELFVVDESGCVYSSATSSIVFERFPAESCFQLFFPFLSFLVRKINKHVHNCIVRVGVYDVDRL
eukprot:m.57270 g.57270  ORF g.57270 m.57270 type:complete len:93 (+) comp11221_c1_seq2:902-1180(+)